MPSTICVVFNTSTLSVLVFLRRPKRFLLFPPGQQKCPCCSRAWNALRSVVIINICTTEQSNKAF